jgi:hypothetical protein
MYRHPLIHKPRSPKLWEEEWDPTELDFINNDVHDLAPDTNILSMNKRVLRHLIEHTLTEKQRIIIEAFSEGKKHYQINITEKTWRYHLDKAIQSLRNSFVDTPYQLKVKSNFKQENHHDNKHH